MVLWSHHTFILSWMISTYWYSNPMFVLMWKVSPWKIPKLRGSFLHIIRFWCPAGKHVCVCLLAYSISFRTDMLNKWCTVTDNESAPHTLSSVWNYLIMIITLHDYESLDMQIIFWLIYAVMRQLQNQSIEIMAK